MRRIVLDTNCLIQSISHRSDFYKIWESFVNHKYYLCVSNEILEEYEEILSSHTSPLIASIVVETILRANNVIRVDAKFHFNLIAEDWDDNKFVDCAIVANADYIVTEDHHFKVLENIPFPNVRIRKLQEFLEEL